MADIRFEPATLDHAEALALQMRQPDIDEVMASHGLTAEMALRGSVENSAHAVAMFLGGELAALFGIVRRPASRESALGVDLDCVWLLTGHVVDRYPVAFFRASQRALKAFLVISPRLFNWVDTRYPNAIQFLTALGFKAGPPIAVGINGESFRFILIERK